MSGGWLDAIQRVVGEFLRGLRRRSGGVSRGRGRRRRSFKASVRRGPVPKRIVAAAGTDVGREREQNEDAYLCDVERGLFIVADGMGGQAAGEQASRMAIEILSEMLGASSIDHFLRTPNGLKGLFQEALERANEQIISSWHRRPEWWGMDSTVVMAVYRSGKAYVCNLGDSRAYLVRRGLWVQLTQDHSIAAALAETGQITEEEARTHPMRNQLTRSLGQRPVKPHYEVAEMQPGDRLVLCSDGLWDMLSDDAIAAVVTQQWAPEAAVEELIRLANQAGGYDNITVIVVAAMDDEEEPEAALRRTREPITAELAEVLGAQEGGEEEVTVRLDEEEGSGERLGTRETAG